MNYLNDEGQQHQTGQFFRSGLLISEDHQPEGTVVVSAFDFIVTGRELPSKETPSARVGQDSLYLLQSTPLRLGELPQALRVKCLSQGPTASNHPEKKGKTCFSLQGCKGIFLLPCYKIPVLYTLLTNSFQQWVRHSLVGSLVS